MNPDLERSGMSNPPAIASSSHSLDNLEGKQFSRDVVRDVTQETSRDVLRDVTQETTRDAHERILICRNPIPLGLHSPGMTLL